MKTTNSSSSAKKNMRKTQIFLRDDQYQALQKMILLTGKKLGVLIREGIDFRIQADQKKKLWKENLLKLSGSLPEDESKEMKQDIQKLRKGWKNRF